MNQKTFTATAATLFLIIGILQAARLLGSWDAVINGWSIPVWLSGIAVVVALFLAYTGFRLTRQP